MTSEDLSNLNPNSSEAEVKDLYDRWAKNYEKVFYIKTIVL
jgi:hypothetical protein